MMSANLEKSLFQLKFTSKTLKKQALRSKKEAEKEKTHVKKAIKDGNNEIAQLYAQNAIRKESEHINLLKMSSRIDAVASRVQTAVTMRTVTGSMASVVKGMDRAMQNMDTETMSLVLDKFETQFEDLDATASYYEDASSNANALQVPQEQVDLLMQQVADEAGLELRQDLDANTPDKVEVVVPEEAVEDRLNERLKALRS